MTQSRLPTEAEWDEWKAHPVSTAVLSLLRAWQADLKDQWAAGAFTNLSKYGTAILNAKAVGTCEAFDKIIELEYSHLLELGDKE